MSGTHASTESGIKTEILRGQVVRLQWTVQMGLVLACLLVPVTRVVDEDERQSVARSLWATFTFFVSTPAEDLGSLEAYPRALVGGHLATMIGVVLVILALVLLVVVSSLLHGAYPPRWATVGVIVIAAALVVGTLLVWLGQTWLPDDDDLAYTPSWGLFVVAATGVWAIQTARGPVGTNE